MLPEPNQFKITYTLVFKVPMPAGFAHQLVVLDRKPTQEELEKAEIVVVNELHMAKIVKNNYGPYITSHELSTKPVSIQSVVENYVDGRTAEE